MKKDIKIIWDLKMTSIMLTDEEVEALKLKNKK